MPTLSQYPSVIDAFTTTHQDNVGEAILAQSVNELADAVHKMQVELGILPKGTWSDVKTRLNALESIVFNTQSGSSYTLLLADATKCITLINGVGTSLLVPTDASVAFPVGTQILIRQGSAAGPVTVAAVTPATTTVQSRGSSFALAGAVAWATLVKVTTNVWDLYGDLA